MQKIKHIVFSKSNKNLKFKLVIDACISMVKKASRPAANASDFIAGPVQYESSLPNLASSNIYKLYIISIYWRLQIVSGQVHSDSNLSCTLYIYKQNTG